MAEDLLRSRRPNSSPMDSDYVFASPKKGKQPYRPDGPMKRYIKPAAREAGINKTVSWHTFRHLNATRIAGSRWMSTPRR